MTFYFPIKINERRIHYFHLRDCGNQDPVPTCSFLVNNFDSPLLLSVNYTSPQLISDAGRKKNVNLADYSFRAEVSDAEKGIYRIYIVNGTPKDVEADSPLVVERVHMKTGRASVQYRTARGEVSHHDITLVLCYEHDRILYQDAVKIHLYKGNNVVKSYAVDFGSEASQIGGLGTNNYVDLIDKFLSFHPQKPQRGQYWQTDAGDRHLYKSVFFLDRKPGDTHFADAPNFAEDAFVKPLMPRDKSISDRLELLPNLKLMEIGQSAFQFDGEFKFTEKTDIDDSNRRTLGEPGMRAYVLRLILSNFLHCILKDVSDLDSNVCLRLVLMVPNVYHQSQINRIVRGLYKDYCTIEQKDIYPKCKGIEIQVVSESDASFMGIRNQLPERERIDASQGYFLIIDAGKGTTDFSILQQQENLNKFNSCFRDGIPASGNILTYAFFEALHAYFWNHGILNLNVCIRDAQKSELLRFMDLLEQFKIRYKEDADTNMGSFKPEKNNLTDSGELSLVRINTYLETLLKNNKSIPGSKHFVDEKVQMLVNGLKESMPDFITEKNIQFKQVILAGRGLLFKPFKDAIVAMLEENGWIQDPGCVLWLKDNRAKSLCIPGALAIEETCAVNENSGLIGNPSLGRVMNMGGESWFDRKKNQWLNRNKKPVVSAPDMKFFYLGTPSVEHQNMLIQIGARSYRLGTDNREKKTLFYVGEGFLCQQNERTELIAERPFFQDDPLSRNTVDEGNIAYSPDLFGENDLMDIIRQSLFPNHPNTIPKDNDMPHIKPTLPETNQKQSHGSQTTSEEEMNK